jgi:hypothetical protein
MREFEFEDVLGNNTVDLLDVATGNILLIDGTYSQIVSTRGEWVIDKFKTITVGDTDTEVRNAVTALEELLQLGKDWFKYPSLTLSTWLRTKTENETSRRTLVKDWSRIDIPEAGVFDHLITNDNNGVVSEWRITRHPDWEELTAATATASGMDANGDLYDLKTNETQLNGGTEVGRIAETFMGETSLTQRAREIWIGITESDSTLSSLDTPITVSAGVGTYYEKFNGTTDVSDGITGSCAQTGFTSTIATIARRFVNHLEEWEHGQYVLLMRARITGAGEAMMRCETGIGYSADFSKIRMEQHPDVYVTSQQWLLYEMGIINIPNMQYRYQNTQLPSSAGEGQISFILGAERISGTMELRCDEWILIPYEHFLYVTEMDHEGSEQIAVTLTHEDDTVESIGSDLDVTIATRTTQIYEMGLNNWTKYMKWD